MRVLITGAAGFIGHHVVEFLLKYTDWEMTIIDRLDISGNLNRLAEIGAAKNPRVRFVYHNLRAPFNELLSQQIGPQDYILHMAAASHVNRSIENPVEFVYDNVVGTCHILDLARSMPSCKKFMYFSTDEVFGPAAPGVAYKEYDRYNSGSAYSATKAGAEELCVAYANTYKLPVQIVHVMNTIGYRQHPEKFLPMLISKISKGEEVVIHGTADLKDAGTRIYMDARDVADAVLILLNSNEFGKFNLVGERETSNLELAQWVASALGKELHYRIVDANTARPGHDLRYSMDGSLMMEKFAWKPQVGIWNRVNEIVSWTVQNDHWLL